MTSQRGLTVSQALPRIMEIERIPDEAERRREYRSLLARVRSLGYHDGSEEERCSG
jgi:hypothetical protein